MVKQSYNKTIEETKREQAIRHIKQLENLLKKYPPLHKKYNPSWISMLNEWTNYLNALRKDKLSMREYIKLILFTFYHELRILLEPLDGLYDWYRKYSSVEIVYTDIDESEKLDIYTATRNRILYNKIRKYIFIKEKWVKLKNGRK